MADILVPQTPPRKVIKAKREANLTGLWEAWEENRQLRKYSRKKGSLLDWEHPSKVGLINRRSLMLNWKVILPLLEIYCPKHEPKTVPVQSLKQQVKRFFEEIEVAPKKGLVHCTSHSLKMFVSYILRRHDGSVRKDHRLKAIFDEVSKSWPAKLRSRRTLLEAEDEPGDDECEKEGQEEEEEEELQLTEDEVEDDSQAAEVDDYLAEDMGLCPGSPQPPSAYVGTVAYELGDEGPVPYQAGLLDRDEGEGGTDTDLVRRLAELEQQIAHRRAALSGQRAIERWHSLQHMDSQRTIVWPERLNDVHEQDRFSDPPAASEAVGEYVRQGAASNLSLGALSSKDVAPGHVPVATPARAASELPALSEDPVQVPTTAPEVSEDLADPTHPAVAAEVSKDLADPTQAAVAAEVSKDLADPTQAAVAAEVSNDLASPTQAAVAPEVSEDLASPTQAAVAPGVLKDAGKVHPGSPCPESVSLAIRSGSEPGSPDLLACQVQTRRQEQMREREQAKQAAEQCEEDDPEDPEPVVKKRPAAKSAAKKNGGKKGWPKGKAKARAKPLEKGDDDEPKSKPAKTGDDEEPKPKPAKRARKGDDEEPKPKPAKKGKPNGDDEEPKPKPAKKGKPNGDDEPKTKPAKKGKPDGDDEPKPKPAKRGKPDGDDEEPKPKVAKKGKRDGDDEPKPKPSKKGKPDGDDEPEPKPAKKDSKPKPDLKKTFARRFEPPNEGDAKCLWTSIRDAFNAILRPHFRFPTKFEDLFWKHCRPIITQEEQPYFRSKAQEVAFTWLEMQRANGAVED